MQGGFGACFCHPGTKFVEHYACRGTGLIGATNLSTITNFNSEHWRSVAMQFVSEPEICHGVEFVLRADALVRVQEPLRIYLEGRS